MPLSLNKVKCKYCGWDYTERFMQKHIRETHPSKADPPPQKRPRWYTYYHKNIEARRAYARDYYAKNREKILEYHRDYYLRNNELIRSRRYDKYHGYLYLKG
jgi:hypothetical protein